MEPPLSQVTTSFAIETHELMTVNRAMSPTFSPAQPIITGYHCICGRPHGSCAGGKPRPWMLTLWEPEATSQIIPSVQSLHFSLTDWNISSEPALCGQNCIAVASVLCPSGQISKESCRFLHMGLRTHTPQSTRKSPRA